LDRARREKGMNSRLMVRVTVLCAFPLTFTACGWIFVSGPPPNHENLPTFNCTTSKTAPVLDVIWGGLNVLGAIGAIATSEEDWVTDYPDYERGTVIGVGLAWGVVSGLAAKSGFQKVNDCNAALQALYSRQDASADAFLSPTYAEVPSWRPPMLLPVRTPLKSPPGS
jgi:hypothetical protein